MMNKALIYLIGFPGSGKSTTAKEISKIIDAVIVSNNFINNIIFNVINLQNAKVPDDLWESIFLIRKNMLAILEKHHIKSKHYIFTNELLKGDRYDQKVYNLILDLSTKMNASIFSVVLHCNKAELAKRVQSKERSQENKITDLDFAMKRIEGERLFIPEGALEIDNSSLSAKEVARKIADKIISKELVNTSVVNHVGKNHTRG
jgi:broad-specificity NMP kinase